LRPDFLPGCLSRGKNAVRIDQDDPRLKKKKRGALGGKTGPQGGNQGSPGELIGVGFIP